MNSLHRLGHCLAGVPRPGPADAWEQVGRLAQQHDLAAAVWASLRETGMTEVVGGPTAGRLQAAYLTNTVRNHAFQRQAAHAMEALNRADIEPLLIKGGLYLFDSTFSDRAARVMGDIDMLVRSDDLQTAISVLEAIGYRVKRGKPFEHPHEVPLVAEGAPGPIELHTSVGSSRLAGVLPTVDAWRHSVAIQAEGCRFRALSPTHRVLHNVLHAQVQDLNHAVAGLPLRQLHTLARLDRHLGAEVDWAALTRVMEAHGLGPVLTGYVELCHRLFLMPLPQGLHPRLAAHIHYRRCLVWFRLGWPPEVHRNLLFAVGRDYMEHLYGPSDGRLALTGARARHLRRVWRERGGATLTDLRVRRR